LFTYAIPIDVITLRTSVVILFITIWVLYYLVLRFVDTNRRQKRSLSKCL